ncbi:MAG: metallophosphoesterase [Candidatus Cloacimonetes bacterium]|nr:metallophosphoesterase [Candidatus Cloacimonadota bacterium]
MAVSDLHGKQELYRRLFAVIEAEQPQAVFIAGDITGGYYRTRLGENLEDFILGFMQQNLLQLRERLADAYPEIFMILGNDDPRYLEDACLKLDAQGLWHYAHNRCIRWQGYYVCGYSCVPPTPFQMKDWEKFDVSRYVDVGAIPPSEGFRTVEVDKLELEWGTIKRDLQQLFTAQDLSQYICLFHSPPYKTQLDRAALDEKMVDYAPVDVHVGSIAIREFITERQPLITIHGHVHESASITGSWSDRIGETMMFNAAHNKPELAIIRFNPQNPQECNRQIM